MIRRYNMIVDSPKKLATALAKAIGRAWDCDHDEDPSEKAKERARQANYNLAGIVMYNANLIVDALRSCKSMSTTRDETRGKSSKKNLLLKEGDRVRHTEDGAEGTVQAFWIVWDDHAKRPLETGPFGASVLEPLP